MQPLGVNALGGVAGAGVSKEAPSVFGVGSTGNQTSPCYWPDGHQAGDIGLLFRIHDSNSSDSITIRTAANALDTSWTPLVDGNIYIGSDYSRAFKLWWKRANSSSMKGVAHKYSSVSNNPNTDCGFSDSSDQYTGIIGIRGAKQDGNPFDVYSIAGVPIASPSSSWSLPNITTPEDACLVLFALGSNFSAAFLSSISNGNLIGLAEKFDGGTTDDNNSAFALAAGVKELAGAIGTTIATLDASLYGHSMAIAVRPK
jgi:hypothetical protein